MKTEKIYLLIDELLKKESKKYSLIINKRYYNSFKYDLDKLSDIFIYIRFEDLDRSEIYKLINPNINKEDLKYNKFMN